MASRVRRLLFLIASLVLVAGATAIAGPLSATAQASACRNFGTTQAQKLSQRDASRSIGCLINRVRHRHGLRHLNSNRRLGKAATRHSLYMKHHNCFSHQCPGEGSVLARLERVNYIVGGLRRWSYGENIAWGARDRGTPKSIVRAWMHSPPHRANILTPQFRHLGVGFARGCPGGKRGASGGTYTTDFGMRKR
jgi:uncharacterized protein YkwD